MHLRARCLLFSVACLGACATACYDMDPPTPLDRASLVTGPGTLTAGEAAFYLARAECAHQNSCDNVGDGRSFESLPSCVTELTKTTEDDLGTYVCPAGIEPMLMRRCAHAILLERCHNLSSMVRMSACNPGALCAPRQLAF